jgi:hypothetical protein
MTSILRQHLSKIIAGKFLIVLFCFGAVGCSKESGRSRSDRSTVISLISGRYAGTGSYIETHWSGAPRLNVAWKADFARQTDSTFVGTMISLYTDTATTMTGESMQWGVKGTILLSGQIMIEETSMVRPNSPKWIWGDQQFLTSFDSCTAVGDTIFYGGPPPEREKFVLVKQK